MKNFFIVSHPQKDREHLYRDEICRYLTERGAICVCRDMVSEKPPADTECIIVLGGDGTLMRTTRQYADLSIPFIGINIGTIGYLTEGRMENAPDILDSLLEDRAIPEKRMMIYARITRNGQYIARHRALDDIVISRSHSMKVILLNVYVNGQFLTQYRADGLIAATPTGSTAYNFSCGGPIAEPTAKMFILTPIAAHSLYNRSLILSSTDTLAIEVVHNPSDTKDEIEHAVYFDGDKQVRLQPGDRVEIAQASTCITILKQSERSFVETLRNKMSV